MNDTEKLFFALLRSGLWGEAPETAAFSPSTDDWKQILRIAREQTVSGVLAEGVARCPKGFVPKEVCFKLIAESEQIRGRNATISDATIALFDLFKKAGIPVRLLKGQGVGDCYPSPQLRTPGDIDLFVRPEDYYASHAVLTPLNPHDECDSPDKLHYSAWIKGAEVEIHGTVRTSLGRRVNDELDRMQRELFLSGEQRSFLCRGNDGASAEIPLPSAGFDSVFIFTHIVQHFFCSGIGLRQLCDWAEFLHRNRAALDGQAITKTVAKMGLRSEWESFMAFTVQYLGLPEEDAVASGQDSDAKAGRIWKYLRKVGNFGKNRVRRDRSKDPYLIRKVESLFINTENFVNHLNVFPGDSVRFFWHYFTTGTSAVLKGR